jgi:carbonic anhydrase
MRLLEAIIDANHRALAGDSNAGIHPLNYEHELPLVALTCIDPRLNAIFPQVLGLPADQFIWLRNAGNVITGPASSTMRSLALACAIKGGNEIAIIGHTDCQVAKTSTMQLLDRLRALGIERKMLPDNINEYFGVFSSERQNVIKSTEIVRSSPLIGPKVPVHGLLVDIETGRVDWLVNGYETIGAAGAAWNSVVQSAGQTFDALKNLAEFKIGEMKFPDTKIGEIAAKAEDWLSKKVNEAQSSPRQPPAPESRPPLLPPKIPMPPPLRPKIILRRGGK